MIESWCFLIVKLSSAGAYSIFIVDFFVPHKVLPNVGEWGTSEHAL